jgi:hypothetical protein
MQVCGIEASRAVVAALAATLALCCAGTASAAKVAPRTAVVGADDVAGLKLGSTSPAPWLGLVSGHATAGSHAAASVLRSSGGPKLLFVSRALVAPSAARAKAFKQALGAVSRKRADAADARALGVSARSLRGARRIVWRDGPVVGELVTVGVAKGDAMVARLQQVVRARVRRTIARSAWDTLLARVAARGGRADAATAVQAFSLAVAHLPGVRVPRGPRGSIPEGTLATSWVLANYGRLTPGVRRAFDKAVRRAFGLSGHPPAGGAQLDAVKAQAIAFASQQTGVDLTLPVDIVRGYPSTGSGAAALGVDASGAYRSSKPPARCIIAVRRGAVSRTTIAHEVFHCLQLQLTGRTDGAQDLEAGRAWLGEGTAALAGCLFSEDGAGPYRKAYANYVEQPLVPLGGRTYDALGFFAHLRQSGLSLTSLPATLKAPSVAAAFPARVGESGPDIFGSWASSLYRTPSLGSAWDVSGPCAPPASRAAKPTPVVLAAGRSVTLDAPAYAAHPYELFGSYSTADAIKVHVASGSVRIGAAGLDSAPQGDAVYCLGNGAGDDPAVAVTGGPKGAKVTLTATNNATVCGPGGTATCAHKLCLPFSGSSAGSLDTGPLAPVGPHANRIPEENAKPGTDPSIWDIPGAGSDDIQGFTTDISANVGQTVHFKIKTIATRYRLDIYRMGYYQGLGARRVDRIEMTGPSNAGAGCLTNAYPGLVDCGNWAESASWKIPDDAVSGIYFAHLVGEQGTTGESHVFFVVRDDASTSDIYYQTSDTTWQAYNNYGGESLYTGGPLPNPDRAAAVSYNRPFATRVVDGGEDWIFNAEYPMVRWLERNGYDVSYESGVDTDRYPALLRQHKVFMSTGHDEYWSGQQRANVEAARDAGVNLAFFSGNEVFWKTRWDNNHRTMVCYKTTHDPATATDPSGVWTGSWRDPNGGQVPENKLTGQFFTVNSGTGAITVGSQYASQPFWRHISPASLNTPLADATLGYEWDSDKVSQLPAAAQPPGFSQPANLTELSSTTLSVPERIQDMGHSYSPGTVTHNLTIYRATSGALVFGAGTVQWSWGLDPVHDRTPNPPADARMQQATTNLFFDMGARPATPPAGIVVG